MHFTKDNNKDKNNNKNLKMKVRDQEKSWRLGLSICYDK